MPTAVESFFSGVKAIGDIQEQRHQMRQSEIATQIAQQKADAEQTKQARDFAAQNELARIVSGEGLMPSSEQEGDEPSAPGGVVPSPVPPGEQQAQRTQELADKFLHMGQIYTKFGEFETGRKFMAKGADLMKTASQENEMKIADKQKQLTMTANIASQVKDQSSLDRARFIAMTSGLPLEGIPEVYDETTAPLFAQLANSALDQKTANSMELAIAREDRANATADELRAHRAITYSQKAQDQAFRRDKFAWEKSKPGRTSGQPTSAELREDYKMEYPEIKGGDLVFMQNSDDPATVARAKAYVERPDFYTWREKTHGIPKPGTKPGDTSLDAQFEKAIGGTLTVPPDWTPPLGFAITRDQLTPENLAFTAQQMGISVAEVKKRLNLP